MRRYIWLVLIAGCSSLPEGAGPGTHVLAFGSIHGDGLLADQAVQRVLIVRTDVTDTKEQMELSVRDSFFSTEPLPAGTRWRMISLSLDDEERPVCLDFSAEKPGLLFLGSLEVQEGFRRVSSPSERQVLQDLLDAWRGTPWEPAILERIRSLV